MNTDQEKGFFSFDDLKVEWHEEPNRPGVLRVTASLNVSSYFLVSEMEIERSEGDLKRQAEKRVKEKLMRVIYGQVRREAIQLVSLILQLEIQAFGGGNRHDLRDEIWKKIRWLINVGKLENNLPERLGAVPPLAPQGQDEKMPTAELREQ